MKNWLQLTLISAFLTLGGCKPTDHGCCDRLPDPYDGYTQYGTPFDKVPTPEDVVMYEVNPLVFSSSRDLQGVIARLDSIKALGVNTVWLMPIYEKGVDRSVGSPYCIKDFKALNPNYGSMEDLRELVEKAHEKEMAVLLDWVANHTSWDHHWMQDKSFYAQENGEVIHPPGTNWTDVAELDYTNTEMRGEMISAMKYWALEANIDGFRCDYAGGVPDDFWRAAIDTLRSLEDRDILMFAESDDYGLLNEGFDMNFSWAVYGAAWNVWNAGADARQLFTAHLDELNNLPQGKTAVRFMTNHDQHAWDGSPEEIFGSNKAAFGVFLASTTMGGVPLLYNGQEKGIPYKLPFFTPTNKAINWSMNPAETVRHKKFLTAYNDYDALRGNTGRQSFSNADVVGFIVPGSDHKALIAVNTRSNNETINLPMDWRNSQIWDIFSSDSTSTGTTLSLGAHDYVLWIK